MNLPQKYWDVTIPTISAMAWSEKKSDPVTPIFSPHFFQLKCRGLTSNDPKWGCTLEFHGLKTAWFPPVTWTKFYKTDGAAMAAMSRAAWARWIHHWHGGRPSFPPENRQWSTLWSWTHFLVAQPIWGSSGYVMGRHLMVAKKTPWVGLLGVILMEQIRTIESRVILFSDKAISRIVWDNDSCLLVN